jgi:tRNA 2-thiouridine synthesizing protein E
MKLEINGKSIEINAQGFLLDLDDWCEDYALELALRDDIELFVDHWELIWYFRDFFKAEQKNPTMHIIVRSLGKMKGAHFHDQKAYEHHIYKLFPRDPVHEICKLAGLPMPPPDT